MKRVYTAPNASMVHILKDMLAERGISTRVHGEGLLGAAGELAPVDTWVELHVVEDRDEAVASRLIKEFLGSSPSHEDRRWTCQQCGEVIEAQFGVCWKCGQSRNRY